MINSKLIAVLSEQFPTATIPDDCSSLALGDFEEWDSLGHFNFLLAVEEAFSIQFSVEQMAELKTLGQIQDVLEQHKAL